MLRSVLILAFLAVPAGAVEIAAPADCAPAIAADPQAAREAAAAWSREGGGAPARLCEAAALEALGATASAALLLTRLAENPNRALGTGIRAVILADAARLWLDADRPDLARAALASAAELAPPDPDRLLLEARAAAAEADWPAARAALGRVLAADPSHALARAFDAAALRNAGEPEAALAQAEAALADDPALPEALFERAAALAELGRDDAAARLLLDFAARHPDHPLAAAASATVQRLGLN